MARVRWVAIIFGSVLVLGVAGAVVAVASRESDTAFLYAQEHPRTLEPQAMEAAVRKGPDPVPGGGRAPSTRAKCRPGGNGPERNPWSCTVSYASGNDVRYRVIVSANGDFHGVDPTNQYVITGHVAGPAPPLGG